MIKCLPIALAVLVMAANASFAQTPCRATTCTQAYHACLGLRCRQQGKTNCERPCSAHYNECMRNGTWRGKVCAHAGLRRE
jgi:hypothetical protein